MNARTGIERLAYVGLQGLLRCLPHAASRAIGHRIGGLAFHLLGRRRRSAAEKLSRELPELAAADLRRIVRASFRHQGAAVCEGLALELLDPVELCRRLTLEGWEHLNDAQERGRGAVLVSAAFFGLWQPIALALATYRGANRGAVDVIAGAALPPLGLGRRHDRLGIRFLPQEEGFDRALETLGGGGYVLVVLGPERGYRLPAQLSLRAQAPLIPVFGYPEPRGRYRVTVRSPLAGIENPASDEEAVERLSRRLSNEVGKEVRRRPELLTLASR